MQLYGSGERGRGIDENGYSMLSGPRGIYVTDEWVYVSDTGNDRIVRFARNSRTCQIVYGGEYVAPPDPMITSIVDPSVLKKPVCMTSDDRGLLIIDAEHNRISRLENYSLKTFFPPKAHSGHRPEQIKFGRSIRIFPTEGTLLVDTWSHRILRLSTENPKDEPTLVAGTPNCFGMDESKLYFPSDVAVHPEGDLIIADTQNNRVLRWKSGAPSGTPLCDHQFAAPISLALENNNLFVCERKLGRVVRVDLMTYDVSVVVNDLKRPWGITVFGGKLFVCDEWKNQVVEVDAARTVVEESPAAEENEAKDLEAAAHEISREILGDHVDTNNASPRASNDKPRDLNFKPPSRVAH
eukprot:GEMP01058182.1.p1 GENE.GEMP01058182.1~~GEMP01058182.1.p1  ORF type:complete len:353 (+),score=86.50 GEMP01058182.1:44-1102(+)